MFDDERVLERTFKCSRATEKAARMRRDARGGVIPPCDSRGRSYCRCGRGNARLKRKFNAQT